jgi:uncharacterized repeat protein (TIGR03803 family)
MRSQRIFLCLPATLVLFAATLFATDAQASAHETVLHNFNSEPWGSLVLDGSGNLYGTTAGGVQGPYPAGMVFELSPKTGGGWTEKVLHTFGKSEDGQNPFANLIFDTAGNLYGTTAFGGSGNCHDTDGPGCGIVFELSPKTGGGWTEKILYNFQLKDGAHSYAGLIMDGTGNLYGTLSNGAKKVCTFTVDDGCGSVFELSPGSGGVWTERTLHIFDPTINQDGSVPVASLALDGSGNLYGTTNYGGAGHCGRLGCGTIFELSPQTDGSWTETILYRFAGTAKDGSAPVGNLIFDKAGKNLYGTTYTSASTVFELTPKSGGGWTKKILHTFGQGTDGDSVFAGVVFDAKGNLYGTSIVGGTTSNAGTVFELSPKTGGGWTEKVVHNFKVSDGNQPYAGVIVDGSGNLYGTTIVGGAHNLGVAFKITP